jgi:hypothetical protein
MQSFSTGYAKGYGNYIHTPDMTNNIMKGINLNPLKTTVDEVEKALNDAVNNEQSLIEYCQDMYMKNMLYKRNADYISMLPSWNLAVRCFNAKPKDYGTAKFKKDYAIVKDFFAKFDYKAEFEKAFVNMLMTETYYCIFRDDISEYRYVLQDFPYRYARISGKHTWGLYYDIDLNYFFKSTVDIGGYPNWIKEKYNELFLSTKQKPYIPSMAGDKRDGMFVNWAQTSYTEGFWCFKFKKELIANIPYFAPMLSELVLLPVYRKLQLSQSTSSARKIIASQWPLLKESKSSSVTDMLAIKPETMGVLMGTFSRSLEDAFKIINLPSDKLEAFEFSNTDQDGYSNFLKQTASLMGGGNVLFSTLKNTVEETRLSLNMDEMLATSIYSQFESH